jgi:hypothetical protein
MDVRPTMPAVSGTRHRRNGEDEGQACPNTRGKVRHGREPVRRPQMTSAAGGAANVARVASGTAG